MQKTLNLASSSKNRLEQLKSLKVDFQVIPPDVDETPLQGEKPHDLVLRLAEFKARSSFDIFLTNQEEKTKTQYWVVGSDQVLEVNGAIFGKPLSQSKAIEQLRYFSGKKGVFHTSICVLHQNNEREIELQKDNIQTTIQFSLLSDAVIRSYLAKEDALNCAGSFKSEGLGVCLLDSVKSTDHSAIIGLPLIRLNQMLNQSGYSVL